MNKTNEQIQVVKRVDVELTVRSERDTEIPVGIIVPEHRKGSRVPLVIACHGYMGNKDEYGYFYGGVHAGSCQGLTEQLAEVGIATVRMSYPGCGDSIESFEFYNIQNMISDTERAYEYVLNNYEIDRQRVGLLGWSNGGRIGALLTEKHPDIKAMVLWAPVSSNGGAMWPPIMDAVGQDYYQLRSEAEASGRAAITWWDKHKDDYLGFDFFIQNDMAKPLDALKKFNGKGLIIIPDQDTTVPAWVYREIMDNVKSEIRIIKGADHSFGVDTGRPELTRINLDITTNFFQKHLI